DGDGRLSVRELRAAGKLLERLDLDRDGKLSRGEIPAHHSIGLALGPGGGDPFGRVVLVPPRRVGMDRPPARGAVRGPVWFQKMDRNRDGDVSRKEFLGSEALFREIDTDGDGLISVEEAEAYDRRMRKR